MAQVVQQEAEAKGIRVPSPRRDSQSRRADLSAYTEQLRKKSVHARTLNHDSSITRPDPRPNVVYQPAIGSTQKINNPYLTQQPSPLEMKGSPAGLVGMELRSRQANPVSSGGDRIRASRQQNSRTPSPRRTHGGGLTPTYTNGYTNGGLTPNGSSSAQPKNARATLSPEDKIAAAVAKAEGRTRRSGRDGMSLPRGADPNTYTPEALSTSTPSPASRSYLSPSAAMQPLTVSLNDIAQFSPAPVQTSTPIPTPVSSRLPRQTLQLQGQSPASARQMMQIASAVQPRLSTLTGRVPPSARGYTPTSSASIQQLLQQQFSSSASPQTSPTNSQPSPTYSAGEKRASRRPSGFIQLTEEQRRAKEDKFWAVDNGIPVDVDAKINLMDKRLLVYFFYEKHNPSKTSILPSLLGDYHANEGALMDSLLLKYKIEKTEWLDIIKTINRSPVKVAEALALLSTPPPAPTYETPIPPVQKPTPRISQALHAALVNSPAPAVREEPAPAPRSKAHSVEEKEAAGHMARSWLAEQFLGGFPGLTSAPAPAPAPTLTPEDVLLKYDKGLLVYFFYEKHNPTKLPTLPSIVNDYKGNEENLMASLLHKYGLDEFEWVEVAKNIEASPKKLTVAREALNKPAPIDISDYDKRLLVYFFYEKHNPTKIESVPSILAGYAGDEDNLMSSLLHKYSLGDAEWIEIVKIINNNPDAVMSAWTKLESPLTTTANKYPKGLLVWFFYDKHNPTKVDIIPSILNDYRGDEDNLMHSLLLKYNLAETEWLEIVNTIDANPEKARRAMELLSGETVVVVAKDDTSSPEARRPTIHLDMIDNAASALSKLSEPISVPQHVPKPELSPTANSSYNKRPTVRRTQSALRFQHGERGVNQQKLYEELTKSWITGVETSNECIPTDDVDLFGLPLGKSLDDGDPMPPLVGLTQRLADHSAEWLQRYARADETVQEAEHIYPRLGIYCDKIASTILLFPSSDFFQPDLPYFKALMGFENVVLKDCKDELKCYSAYGEGGYKLFRDYYDNRHRKVEEIKSGQCSFKLVRPIFETFDGSRAYWLKILQDQIRSSSQTYVENNLKSCGIYLTPNNVLLAEWLDQVDHTREGAAHVMAWTLNIRLTAMIDEAFLYPATTARTLTRLKQYLDEWEIPELQKRSMRRAQLSPEAEMCSNVLFIVLLGNCRKIGELVEFQRDHDSMFRMWKNMTRFFYNSVSGRASLQIGTSEINCGWDFWSGRMLIETHLSQEVFRALTNSMTSRQQDVFFLDGPAGSGKTETAVDFFKLIGYTSVKVVCSLESDIEELKRYIQTSARGEFAVILDSFNNMCQSDQVILLKEAAKVAAEARTSEGRHSFPFFVPLIIAADSSAEDGESGFYETRAYQGGKVGADSANVMEIPMEGWEKPMTVTAVNMSPPSFREIVTETLIWKAFKNAECWAEMITAWKGRIELYEQQKKPGIPWDSQPCNMKWAIAVVEVASNVMKQYKLDVEDQGEVFEYGCFDTELHAVVQALGGSSMLFRTEKQEGGLNPFLRAIAGGDARLMKCLIDRYGGSSYTFSAWEIVWVLKSGFASCSERMLGENQITPEGYCKVESLKRSAEFLPAILSLEDVDKELMDKLLCNPIVTSLIFWKWRHVKKYWLREFVWFCLFLVSWLGWALGQVEEDGFGGNSKTSVYLTPGGVDLGWIAIGLFSPLALIEFLQMTKNARGLLNMNRMREDGMVGKATCMTVFWQLATPTQITDWATYFLVACNILGMGKIESLGNITIAAATFLVFFRLMRYLTAIKQFGFLVFMLRGIYQCLVPFLGMMAIMCTFFVSIFSTLSVPIEMDLDGDSYADIWKAVKIKAWGMYRLAFMGDFEDGEFWHEGREQGWTVTMAFVCMTLVVNIVMLNVLIAIVGEGYNNVILRKEQETNKQLCESVVELEATYLQRTMKFEQKEGGEFVVLKYHGNQRLRISATGEEPEDTPKFRKKDRIKQNLRAIT
ncbi:hypothetical protein TL16_g05452 [Triparma laevis f. inornata]|uniref:Dynein heavy chain hydrolytic ATP-binding dynein motor region domain-containing protein n=1 Tax=Triparma laevis f. inornata TaxID=1714386 RepID=A0A9W7AH35_9STRA|nr:hypothetical protein TL16_g05452 [Triparma laevis f. inornata]